MTKKTIKKNYIDEFNKQFGAHTLSLHHIYDLKELQKALADQKKEIGQDLLKIADAGEIEELRRVIVNYFHIKK